MKRGQLLIVLLAVVAIIAVAVGKFGGGGSKDHGGDFKNPQTNPGATRVEVAASPEKVALLASLAKKYTAEHPDVDVEIRSASSGDEEKALAAGRSKPTVWSPASSLWGRLLDHEADTALVPDDNPSIVRSPLVIAMWEPLARALGWPKKRVGFADVLRLARDPRGWGSVGHPEFGRFKYVHTNPDVSTSGLEAVAAEYSTAAGKREGLTVADLGRVKPTIRAIERAIVHYGDTTLYIADQLRRNGPGYASAVAMEETTLVDFNRHRGRQPRLVALYPREGTFVSDSPYIIPRAPWVTAKQRVAAQDFQKFLADEIDAHTAARYGFRPADPSAPAVAPVAAVNGADPAQPTRLLGLPDPAVLAGVQRAWRADRKPANVLLVLDTSGSMSQEGRLDRAKVGLGVFLRQLAPFDRVGLLTFSNRLRLAVPVGQFRRDGGRLRSVVRDLFPDGETALYDATARSVALVRALKDDTRINAVVLLTDGQDTASAAEPKQVLADLRRQSGVEGGDVRVFTIAYGSDADRTGLAAIARASNGQAYEGKPEDIERVYRSISSFF